MYILETTIEDVVNNHYLYEDSKQALIDDITIKFLYFVQQAKTFVVEDYVENEWRDSYDLYYSRSSYSCPNTVKRVHFINEEIEDFKDINESNYFGYVNLRPIPPVSSVLSRIRLKCTKDAFELEGDNKFFCLSVFTTVNFPHIAIKYKSFPLYSQDSMVAVCAHADLLMISKYMYKKFNFNNYTLKDIVQNDRTSFNVRGRKIPSEGLTINQIIDLLKRNNYNPSAALFDKGKYGRVEIIDYIDSFVESALPTIIAFDGHVMVVIGHVDRHNGEKHYIIADDSAYHLVQTFGIKPAHIELVESRQLHSILWGNDVYVITPTFDRFYLHYPYLSLILDETKSVIKETFFPKIDEVNMITREILVDSTKLKQFLCECGDDSYESVKMPHYVWYIEFYIDEKVKENLAFYMLVDATAHKLDRTYSIITNNIKDPIMIAKLQMTNEVKQLSLLTDI